jgi:hypothetical protein
MSKKNRDQLPQIVVKAFWSFAANRNRL